MDTYFKVVPKAFEIPESALKPPKGPKSTLKASKSPSGNASGTLSGERLSSSATFSAFFLIGLKFCLSWYIACFRAPYSALEVTVTSVF